MYAGGYAALTDWLRIFLDVEKKQPVLVNLQELIKSRALLQANSGGGKSHVMRKGIEEAHGKVQQIIIDPEGEFHTLREKYTFLLVGTGPQADIQIDSKHAALLAKKIMESRADVIIDLYELNPSERIRFVKLFCEALVNLSKHLWHQCLIWLDEIHVFAPESKSGRSESLAAVAALASRGRKRGYGLIGATQRISKLSKDVAAELNTKFIGRCSLDVDRKRAGEELGIRDTTILRKLKHEFYAFGPAISDDNILVKAYDTKTSHEELGSIKGYSPSKKGKIQGLMKNFSELPQEAELDLKTKEGLQLKVQELKTKLSQAERLQPKQDPQAIERSYDKGFRDGFEKTKQHYLSYEKQTKNTIKQMQSKYDSLILMIDTIHTKSHTLDKIGITKISHKPEPLQSSKIIEHVVSQNLQSDAQASVSLDHGELRTMTEDEVKLGRCEESCLKALAQRGKPSSKLQIAAIAGYSYKSGGFNNAISKLKSSGFISSNGAELEITQEGLSCLGSYTPIESDSDSLLVFWKSKLGKCSASILECVHKKYPESISKEDVAIETNYSVGSGGFNNGISKLNSLGLISRDNGNLKASKEMFPDEF